VVWTRATARNETLVCDEDVDDVCPQTYVSRGNDGPFYIAQAEAFTILLEHAVTSSPICQNHQQASSSSDSSGLHYSCSAQAKDYGGRLLSTNPQLCNDEFIHNNSFVDARSKTLTPEAPCYIGPNRTTAATTAAAATGQDFFSLDVLLRAAGVTLDDCVGSDTLQTTTTTTNHNNHNNNNKCSNTLRSSGATLLLQVNWNDFAIWRGRITPHYTYVPRLIGDSYKESQAYYYTPYRTSRTVVSSRGIKVAVLVGGSFHEFRMLNFLVTLTTALGLLAVSRVVVDYLMLYVLPDKVRYKQAKFETVFTTRRATVVQDVSLPLSQEDAPASTTASLGEPLLPLTNPI